MDNLEATVKRNSLKYLYNIDSLFKDYDDMNILKTYYLQKFKKREMQQKSIVPAKLSKPTVKCPKCYVTRTLDCTRYHIIRGFPCNRFNRRQLKRLDSNKNYSKFQRRAIRKLKKSAENKLVIQCLVCKTDVVQNIKKPLPDSKGNKTTLNDKFIASNMKTSVKLPDSKSGARKNKKKDARSAKNKIKSRDKLSKVLMSKPSSSKGKTGSLRDFLNCVNGK